MRAVSDEATDLDEGEERSTEKTGRRGIRTTVEDIGTRWEKDSTGKVVGEGGEGLVEVLEWKREPMGKRDRDPKGGNGVSVREDRGAKGVDNNLMRREEAKFEQDPKPKDRLTGQDGYDDTKAGEQEEETRPLRKVEGGREQRDFGERSQGGNTWRKSDNSIGHLK